MKWFLRSLAGLLLVLCVALLLIRFSPQILITTINLGSDYVVSAESVDVRYFPPSLSIGGFGLSLHDDEIAKLNSLEASTYWSEVFAKRAPYALVKARNGFVDLRKLESTPNSPANSKVQSSLNLFELLNTARVDTANVTLRIDDQNELEVQQLSNWSNKRDTLELELKANYLDQTQSILINALAALSESQQGDIVEIKIPQLDLTGLLTVTETHQDHTTAESELNWGWLKQLAGTQFNLVIDKLILPQGRINDLNGHIDLGQGIAGQFSADIDVTASESLEIKDKVDLEFQLKPLATSTLGADVEGSIKAYSRDIKGNTAGRFNFNGAAENNFDLDLSIASIPLWLTIDKEFINQYIPIKAKANVGLTNEQINLSKLAATLGDSDLNGTIEIPLEPADINAIKFDLNSKRIAVVDPSPPETETEPKQTEPVTAPVFSSEPIDWSWINSSAIEGQLRVDELSLYQSEIRSLNLPIRLNAKGLNIDTLAASLNAGEITADLSIEPASNGVNTFLGLKFTEVDMSKSGLIEPGQIEGGLVNGNVQLSSEGLSARDLAKNLSGHVYANVGAGEITQGGFEILGSDLILGTLQKLNPFTKSDPSTKLDCAVINLRVEQGILQAKNSIAMETSKLAIIGTGKVNLQTEKLDLRFNPKSKRSLGASLSSLAKAVKLGGTLSRPQPEISAAGLAETGLSVGAAVSTGGLSLLAEGLLDDVTADQACRNARGAFQGSHNKAELNPQSDETAPN